MNLFFRSIIYLSTIATLSAGAQTDWEISKSECSDELSSILDSYPHFHNRLYQRRLLYVLHKTTFDYLDIRNTAQCLEDMNQELNLELSKNSVLYYSEFFTHEGETKVLLSKIKNISYDAEMDIFLTKKRVLGDEHERVIGYIFKEKYFATRQRFQIIRPENPQNLSSFVELIAHSSMASESTARKRDLKTYKFNLFERYFFKEKYDYVAAQVSHDCMNDKEIVHFLRSEKERSMKYNQIYEADYEINLLK